MMLFRFFRTAIMKRSILRFPSVKIRYGKGHSGLYDDIANGLFTRQVKLGLRCGGWPDDEVDAIIAARIGGADDDAIRQLVKSLHEARKTAGADIPGAADE